MVAGWMRGAGSPGAGAAAAAQLTERHEAAVAAWREEVWPVIKAPRRIWAAESSATSPSCNFAIRSLAGLGGVPLLRLVDHCPQRILEDVGVSAPEQH